LWDEALGEPRVSKDRIEDPCDTDAKEDGDAGRDRLRSDAKDTEGCNRKKYEPMLFQPLGGRHTPIISKGEELVYNGPMRSIGYLVLIIMIGAAVVLIYQNGSFARDPSKNLGAYVALQKTDP